MATYYVDLYDGSDANNGTTWALAWKTLKSGATAARLADGDVVRTIKTPDPTLVCSADWDDGSVNVTLTTAQTLTIENCESVWEASTYVEAGTSTDNKQGTNSCTFSIETDFTTGKVAYKTITETNFEDYDSITFWIKNTAVLGDDVLTLELCSDTLGNTKVDTFLIPAIPSTTSWIPMTIKKYGGGNLGSAIQSIAIYASSDPNVQTIYLDNISACNDGGLSLISIISKTSAAQGGDWWCIQSLDGTTLQVAGANDAALNLNRGYCGETEIANLYKRETFHVGYGSASTTALELLNKSGSENNKITYSFGWDKSTSTQIGETFLDGRSGMGAVLSANLSNVIVDRVCTIRSYRGFYNSTGVNNTFNIINISGSYYAAYSATSESIIEGGNIVGCYAEFVINSAFNTIINNLKTHSTQSRAVYVSYSIGIIFKNLTINRNYTYGAYLFASTVYIENFILNNSGYGLNLSKTNVYLKNHIFSNINISEINGSLYKIYVLAESQTIGNNKVYKSGTLAYWQTTTKYGTQIGAWEIDVTSEYSYETFPYRLKIGEINFDGTKSIKAEVYVKKDHATDVQAKLIVDDSTLLGITSVSDTKANDTSWEKLSVTFTPTGKGVVPIYIDVWNPGSSYTNSSVYIGKLESEVVV